MNAARRKAFSLLELLIAVKIIEQGTNPEALAAHFANRVQPTFGPNGELHSPAGSWASSVDDLGTRHDVSLGQLRSMPCSRTF